MKALLMTIHLYFKVLASRTKIYIILEFITGGELFDKIVSTQNSLDGLP